MKRIILFLLSVIPCITNAQDTARTTDLRDSFIGTYACTGLPWYPAVIHTWPILYVSVEKSLTDSTILYFNDSTFGVINEEYRHPATFYSDSTYYREEGYFGDFKKQDTIHMINVVPTVGGYNIYCPKVITTATGVQFVKEKYHLFPNPFSDELYLFSIWPEYMTIDVKLFNNMGKCCYSQQISGQTNGCVFNLYELPPGIYIIEINNGIEIVYRKVVKE